jgi:hypothetical protein
MTTRGEGWPSPPDASIYCPINVIRSLSVPSADVVEYDTLPLIAATLHSFGVVQMMPEL